MRPTSIIAASAGLRQYTRHCHNFYLPLFSQILRRLSSQTQSSPSPPETTDFPLSHPVYAIWGANTGVGKTLVSAGLAASVLCSRPSHSPQTPAKVTYIKPVQTGFPADSDSRFVYRKVSELFFRLGEAHGSLHASNFTSKTSFWAAEKVLGSTMGNGLIRRHALLKDLGKYEERRVEGKENLGGLVSKKLSCKTLWAWRDAVSPHLAMDREGGNVRDEEVVEAVKRCLWVEGDGGDFEIDGGHGAELWSIIETAGGVASPGPSGTLQCDLYRPLRPPAVLVGDGNLGGISGTVSAYETLKLRGFDVAAIVIEDYGLLNEKSLSSYLRNSTPVIILPPVPKDPSDDLMDWFDESRDAFTSLKEVLLSVFVKRVERLQAMSKKARDVLWWPFTQHQLISNEAVTVIDSRYGDNFAVHQVMEHDRIAQQFDGCASWWTQGPDYPLQVELARDMGYTAARYGHVMFPENVHEPALACAELLLEGVGKGWASRTFFSDNGSTAVEVALKMAFRKFLWDHGLASKSDKDPKIIDLRVLALKGSYHGDTLGAMEAQSPSSYTGFLQQPWYTGRGVFLEPPTIYMRDWMWILSLPQGLCSKDYKPESCAYRSLEAVFAKERDDSDIAKAYISYILKELSSYLKGDTHVGALLIEPVIQGAGGMLMIDPLFQRMLVEECRKRKVPVIFDEVFTGFWRLGVESAAELLHCTPDIACYAKLMTGGIIPLAATVATEDVFSSFMADSKLKALLHGHSYSAHAMGCSAARRAIKWFKDPETNFNLLSDKKCLQELWDMELIGKLSSHPATKRVIVLGTLCAVELQAEGSNSGYGSVYARSLLMQLREGGVYMRPLGNVVYLMCGPCTPPNTCHQLLMKLYDTVDEFYRKNT